VLGERGLSGDVVRPISVHASHLTQPPTTIGRLASAAVKACVMFGERGLSGQACGKAD